MSVRISLPPAVARIYEAVAELEQRYPGRKFTPDGHLVGSIGEVVAAEALGLKLHPASYPGHDAYDADGDVQIKMTGQRGSSVSLYATCNRLVVLKIVSPHEAEIVYDGPGEPAWAAAGAMGKNGQRSVGLSKLRALAARACVDRPSTMSGIAQSLATATEAEMQASAAVVRALAADAVDEALSGSGATAEQKAERRGTLTDEPAVICQARGQGPGVRLRKAR
ncbi:DUF6998 domain-containing protein [Bosea sp. RAC05]|uniref:DUF6998 domain-containing protein n=1 Tax=Bosea sp. RAC05 TaxID=1842539 RepID=UPI00085654BC|nr:hypothetical protein [Bosea sp. RAC05]AOG04568.1 hypothetical protein BSY19_2686 [Bosea sp. RAC05]